MSMDNEASTGKPTSKPGVYKSDMPGHILVLKWQPTSVTCITCAELCSSNGIPMSKFRVMAKDFTSKHGYLGEFIADKIEDVLKAN